MSKDERYDLHVVLVEPEIPQNTGNIARTCAAVGASLHLVEPLGFSIEDRYLKRAGLDYWHLLTVRAYPDFGSYKQANDTRSFVYATKRSSKVYTDVRYEGPCTLVFGKETQGLPDTILSGNEDRCVRIPMTNGVRSLNLSNAVAILVYEALKENGFPGLELRGNR